MNVTFTCNFVKFAMWAKNDRKTAPDENSDNVSRLRRFGSKAKVPS